MRMRITLTSTLLFSISPTTALASVIVSRGVDVASSPSLLRHRDTVSSSSSLLFVRDIDEKTYLPAQIGGIVGAYALSLVIVAALILLLSKRRREHLEGGEDFGYIQQRVVNPAELPQTLQLQDSVVPYAVKSPTHTNFSYPQSPGGKSSYVQPSLSTSFRGAPGLDPDVDQEVVSADREMAQSQLEEMYKYVMEQEDAKASGIVLEDPPAPVLQALNNNGSSSSSSSSTGKLQKESHNSTSSSLFRKDKGKPLGLTLNIGSGGGNNGHAKEERRESRTSAILAALKSPRKKKMQGINISSPIMTPMSGTFPRAAGEGGEEMNTIPPRLYAPAAPPPVPTGSYSPLAAAPGGSPLTPDLSPQSTLSIDQRIGAAIVTTNLPPRQPLPEVNGSYINSNSNGSGHPAPPRHQRQVSNVTSAGYTERDPDSAVSQDSSAPLVGLPSSPKPGVNRFPSLASLPSSPRSSTFSRTNSASNAPSAVRTGGMLPLRAYESSLASPSFSSFNQTKQTVFERTPQSPTGPQTPWTGAGVPYSPYQPFSPVIPVTPTLVTKADRKRMKRMEPKTPTMEMVKSVDETW